VARSHALQDTALHLSTPPRQAHHLRRSINLHTFRIFGAIESTSSTSRRSRTAGRYFLRQTFRDGAVIFALSHTDALGVSIARSRQYVNRSIGAVVIIIV